MCWVEVGTSRVACEKDRWGQASEAAKRAITSQCWCSQKQLFWSAQTSDIMQLKHKCVLLTCVNLCACILLVRTAAAFFVFKELQLKWTKYFCGLVCFFWPWSDESNEWNEVAVQVQSNVKGYQECETYLESNKKGREDVSASNSLVILSLRDVYLMS